MSGSGGGGYGGGFADEEISCERLAFDTQIGSPKAPVIAMINVGDILSVVLEQQGVVTVVVLKHGNDVAGGITSPKLMRLLECLRQGTRYSATVISKTDGQVGVRIAPMR